MEGAFFVTTVPIPGQFVVPFFNYLPTLHLALAADDLSPFPRYLFSPAGRNAPRIDAAPPHERNSANWYTFGLDTLLCWFGVVWVLFGFGFFVFVGGGLGGCPVAHNSTPLQARCPRSP